MNRSTGLIRGGERRRDGYKMEATHSHFIHFFQVCVHNLEDGLQLKASRIYPIAIQCN